VHALAADGPIGEFCLTRRYQVTWVGMICAPGETSDAALWWRAYQLAGGDQDDKLRAHAQAGDNHARLQLAGWLADRRRTEEAIAVIRPLANAGDDIARLWLARWLAERDDPQELRELSKVGDFHALAELAGWLAARNCYSELSELVAGNRAQLANWLSRQHDMRIVQVAAECGDETARERLDHWLFMLRERAARGEQTAQRILANWESAD
jgi:hypothetical protein